ncbi:hypothetical protein [Desulfosporosinus sp.]|uniref:hypothetical protein n=1 Tax=Desulfosporosinus sp. TaxID=157907 RepID=UPI00230B4702|nr:hypothetical protein [Desulfosporosinus sp.]MCO5386180.1 hypothetical protein [Desulfosporosinus sp.]MDA8220441.1 hypothetical protein [Desulfitobacterium hafniense]
MPNEEFVPDQGEAKVDEGNGNDTLTNQLDDSIGLSQQKLRNSEVKELTFS